MGESYRGLTIRIGGDTTGLSKALRSADSAIKQTQSELKKINQGLKFDSTSTMLINSKIDELGQRSQQANARLVRMKETLNSLKGTAVEKLAQESQNLALAAENARARYARVDEELARTYNALEKVAKENEIAFDRDNVDKSIAALKEQGLITDRQIAKIRELRKAHNEAFDSNEIHKQALQYKDLTIEIQRTEAEVKNYVKAQSALKSSSWDKQRSEVKALKEELDNISGISQILKNEFKTLESALKLDPGNIDNINQVSKNLTEQMELAENRATSLQKAISRLEDSGISDANKSTKQLAEAAQLAESRYEKATQAVTDLAAELQKARENAIALEAASGKGSNEYKEQQAQVKALEQELKKLVEVQEQASHALDTARSEQELNSLRTQLKATNTEMGELQGQMSGLTAKSSVANSAIKSIGMTAYATVSPAFMQLGYSSINAADQIDSAFRNMKKTVNGTEEDFNNLRDAAIEFSRTNAVSADTILNIESMGGQLGIAVENLEAFGEVVSNLDIATNMEADVIAEKLGQLNGIMPDINDNYEAFGDALVRLGNNMPAQESAIMDITSRIGSMGSIVGMTTPEILAWATAIASTGQGSESAGTAISNTMSDIETAVSSGGDKLEAFAEIAGMSAQEFADAWNNTPSDAMQAFIEGLKRINDEGGSVDGTLQSLGITGVRQKQALQGLTQTCDTLNDSLTMSEDAWNGVGDEWGEAGDAAREAAQKSEGFSGTLQILKNSAAELGYEFGQALIPFMEAATTAIQVFTDAFKAAPDPIKGLAVAVGLLGVASGPAITGYSSFANLMSEHKKNAAAATAAQKAMNTSTEVAGTAAALAGNNFEKSSKKAKLLAVQTKAASVAMTGLKVAAGVGGVVAVSMLADQLMKAYAHMENLNKATDGLSEATRSINTSQAQNNLTGLSDSADDTALSLDALIEKQAQLADTIIERNQEVANNKGMLDEYKSVIDELGGQSDLTADQAGRLQTALDGVNSICGTNYELVSNSAGGYSIMKDGVEETTEAINDLIKAQQTQMEIEALQSTYQDEYKQQAEAAKTLAAEKEKLAEVETDLANSAGMSNEELTTLNSTYEAQKARVQEAQEAYDAASDSMSKADQQVQLLNTSLMEGASANTIFAASSDSLKNALMQASGNTNDFIAACDNMGISLEDLAATNEDAMLQLASSWDGNLTTLLAKADELGSQLPQETRDAILQAAASMINASPSMVSAAASACNMSNAEFIKFAQDAGLSGDDAMRNFVTEMNNGAPDAQVAAQNVKDAAAERLNQFASEASKAGDTSGFSNKIRQGAGSASSASNSVASSAKWPLYNLQNSSSSWGSHMASNFAAGIRGGAGLIGDAASYVASVAASILRHSIPKKEPLREGGKGEAVWGQHLVENFANGMIASAYLVDDAGKKVASNAKNALDNVITNPVVEVKALITEISLSEGAQLLLPAYASELASRAKFSSTVASIAAADYASNSITTNNSSQTIVYQIGDITLQEGSDAAKALENFVDLVIDSKGAM